MRLIERLPYALGTGYDYLDLPGLGNNNEKLGLPERLSTGIQSVPVQEPISRKKNRVIVILFVRIIWSYYYPEKTKLVKQKKQPYGFMHP